MIRFSELMPKAIADVSHERLTKTPNTLSTENVGCGELELLSLVSLN